MISVKESNCSSVNLVVFVSTSQNLYKSHTKADYFFPRYEITAIPHAAPATSKGRPPPSIITTESEQSDDDDYDEGSREGFREPGDLSTEAADLKMGVGSFCKAFPWHFVIDRKMEIVQLGKKILY